MDRIVTGKINKICPQVPSILSNDQFAPIRKFHKFIIDTDGGNDDIHAIMIAFHIIKKYRQDAEIIGITTVKGNVPMDQAIQNCTIALRASQSSAKIYKGCQYNMLRSNQKDEMVIQPYALKKYLNHFDLDNKKLESFFEDLPAVDFLFKSVEYLFLRYSQELCLICLGPLTNIYMAHQINPNFSHQLGGLFIFGGSYLSLGNSIKPRKEFNFSYDPESANSVLKYDFNFCSIIPLDLILGLQISQEQQQLIFKNQQKTIKSQLVQDVSNDQNQKSNILCDCIELNYIFEELCIILALLPDLITNGFKRNINICCDGKARGQMMIDWNDNENQENFKFVVTGVDAEKVLRIVIENNDN